MLLESIALQMTPGIGPVGAVHLLEVFGDARAVFAASAGELVERAELRPDLAEALVRRSAFGAAERELAYCRKHAITAIPATDPAYPALLREAPAYPIVLYVLGDPAALQNPSLAVVGTRQATPWGVEQCRRIVGGLADRIPRFTVVSDLSYGIPVAAHRAAHEFGAASVAVVANPLPAIQPAGHRDVVRNLLAQGGAVVAEFHSQTKSSRTLLLSRNRLTAALAAGCLVAEAPAGSGALTTARYADEYHRAVLAIPGRPTDRNAAGANHLIRTRKAQLVCTADDVIAELMWDLNLPAEPRAAERPDAPAVPRKAAPQPAAFEAALSEEERQVLESLSASDPRSLEEVQVRSGLGIDQLCALLGMLEITGLVRLFPGNKYLKRCD